MDKTVNYRRRGGEGTLTLCGVVDIFEAEALREAALRALGDGSAAVLQIDLSRAERLDVSALQTLSALRHGVEAAGRTSAISDVPDVLTASWEKIGYSL